MVTFAATTEDMHVTVQPVYLSDQSDLMALKSVFAYFVRIENRSSEEVQLLRRHWYIADAQGQMQEVEGEGVVGQQPIIVPGEVYTYNSFALLRALEGSMEGTYLMQRPGGERFRIAIPRFYLRAAAN